ncbi:MAG: response regulator [Proteobacteria bacterium]|nr:response regulator [Pseudomonadota bacterium]
MTDERDMGQRKRVLYIEDETDLQWLVKHILGSAGGFEVLVCASGAEGLRRVSEFSPDLILLDVMMPEMDGFSVLRALRAMPEHSTVPVVFLTARAEQGGEYRASGADGVIAKPFEPKRLLERVRAYTGEFAAA